MRWLIRLWSRLWRYVSLSRFYRVEKYVIDQRPQSWDENYATEHGTIEDSILTAEDVGSP